MRKAMKAEWYKLSHDRLIWLVPIYYIFIGWYNAISYYEIMDYRKGLELFVMPDAAWLQLAFAVVIVPGYIIGADFSKRTIQNALAAGVSKKEYYFSRLLVQAEFMGVMYALALLVHTVCRLVRPKGNSEVAIECLWGKLLIYLFVVLLLLWAYVSIINMLAYFVRKQVIIMAVGMGIVYLELILHQIAEANGWEILRLFLNWLPSNVKRNLFEHAVYDTIFTPEFLQYGLSGIVIIVISSAVGYIKFSYGTDVN